MREKGNENVREGGKEKRPHRLNVEIKHEKIQLSGVFSEVNSYSLKSIFRVFSLYSLLVE